MRSFSLLTHTMFADYLKTLPQYLLPKHLLTIFAGLLANVKSPSVKDYLIRSFIDKYSVNMQEAQEENYQNYASFNDFFIRHLKPEVRVVAEADIVSPVDGCVSEIGLIQAGQLLQAKGHQYSVAELLMCEHHLTAAFQQGRYATLYLSPKDYHRVHMPLDATLQEMIYLPGKLFSVQPTTVRVVPSLFARNERLVAIFDTSVGLMAMVLVGATIVGAIGTSWHGELNRKSQGTKILYSAQNAPMLKKAAEMGYFKLGSTVILLFADAKRTEWRADLVAGMPIRFGEAMGYFPSF